MKRDERRKSTAVSAVKGEAVNDVNCALFQWCAVNILGSMGIGHGGGCCCCFKLWVCLRQVVCAWSVASGGRRQQYPQSRERRSMMFTTCCSNDVPWMYSVKAAVEVDYTSTTHRFMDGVNIWCVSWATAMNRVPADADDNTEPVEFKMMMIPCWFVVHKLVAAAGGRIVGCRCLIVILLIFEGYFLQ